MALGSSCAGEGQGGDERHGEVYVYRLRDPQDKKGEGQRGGEAKSRVEAKTTVVFRSKPCDSVAVVQVVQVLALVKCQRVEVEVGEF